MKKIYLAGGCFWGVQAYLDMKNGITKTIVGYANGNTPNPTYEDVCTNTTGYAETVYVEYDEKEISLEKVLEHFFKVIDPTSVNKQGGDCGTQYRTGIYYVDNNDIETINKFVENEQTKYDKKIVTEVEPLKNFYDAEEYHQKYLVKNPNGYCHINLNI